MENKFYAALLISVMFNLGCKKKANENPGEISSCETKYEVRYGESPSGTTLSAQYQNGQIKSINYDEQGLSYEYASDHVTLSSSGIMAYRIGIVNKLASSVIDDKGRFEDRYTYDANKNLVKVETYADGNLNETGTFTYSNGNLATFTQTYPEDASVKKITTYNYSTELAGSVEKEARYLFFTPINAYIPSFLSGNVSKNTLTSSLYTYQSGNFRTDITKTYTYTKGNDGKLSQIVENTHSLTVSNGVQTQDEQTKQSILISSTCN